MRRKQILNHNVANELFLEPDAGIIINGNVTMTGFQESRNIIINGNVEMANFDDVRSIIINGNIESCVFISCRSVNIQGKARDCIFLNMDRQHITIADGTRGNCQLNGEPFTAVPPEAVNVFNLGNVRIGRGGGNQVVRMGGGSNITIGSGSMSLFGAPSSSRSIVQIGSGGNVNSIQVSGSVKLQNQEIVVDGSGTIDGIAVTPGRYRRVRGGLERYSASGGDWVKWK